jgi:pimeloyl-ACP methyl ester carboxylesterase
VISNVGSPRRPGRGRTGSVSWERDGTPHQPFSGQGPARRRWQHIARNAFSVPSAVQPSNPYVEATGAKLYFEECGDGYPIIFIHEFASDLRGWEAQVRYFSRSYRCISYNARGYPRSDVPEDASLYRWQFAVDDIAAVMRDLKIERAHLVGLSMGGYAALQFGLRYPEKASAVVAASVGSGSHPSHRDAWLRETSVLARIFIEHGMVSMSERMARGPARIQLKYALRPSLHDLRHQFSEMTVPVLLAVGDEDVRCLETNLMLKSALSNAGLWICPNTGHAINLEERTAFNAQIESFLSAVERGSWRRGFPGTEVSPHIGWCRRACRDSSSVQVAWVWFALPWAFLRPPTTYRPRPSKA